MFFSKSTCFAMMAAVFQLSAVAGFQYSDEMVMVKTAPEEATPMVKVNGEIVSQPDSRRLFVDDDEYTCPPGFSFYLIDIIPPKDGPFWWVLFEYCEGNLIMESHRTIGFWKKFCFPDGTPIVFLAAGEGSFSAKIHHKGPADGIVVVDVEAYGSPSSTASLSSLTVSGGQVDIEAMVSAMGPDGFYAGVLTVTNFPYYCVNPWYYTSYGGGDPHFRTWANHWYDFHGACDLVSVSAHNFTDSDTQMAIHTRTTSRYEYSYIEAAAVKIGDDVLQVSSYGEYFVNGVEGADMPTTLAGYPVTLVHKSKKQHVFDIELSDTEHIVLESYKDLVGIKLQNATHDHFGGSFGLMGEFGSGMMLGRDGATEITDPNAFGQEWQVRDTDEQLFVSSRYPQYPIGCVMPDAVSRQKRRLGESRITEEQAKAACLAANNEESLDACVYDVIATGDLDIALAGAF